MTRVFFGLMLIAASTLAPAAQAACYADYKAKQDGQALRLHYGVMEIDIEPCALSDRVAPLVADRLSREGWDLLQVQSVFGDDGLEERKQDAGQFFLRF